MHKNIIFLFAFFVNASLDLRYLGNLKSVPQVETSGFLFHKETGVVFCSVCCPLGMLAYQELNFVLLQSCGAQE